VSTCDSVSRLSNALPRYDAYKNVDRFLRDFELMMNNAIRFNGEASAVAQSSIRIYNFVKGKVEESRRELAELEVAVAEQMSGKTKKQNASNQASMNTATIGGVSVFVGDVDFDADSDSDSS